jgi:succinate dehydrogenase/fumarate reductase flavoprotein subunit
MSKTDTIAETIKADVLVIGGGISGLHAAIRAAENGADVLVVDKGGIGWAGCVPLTAGICMAVPPERFDDWFNWAVRENGEYLNNQDWTRLVGNEAYRTVTGEVEELKLPYLEENGELVFSQRQRYYPTARYNPAKLLIKLKSAAKKNRARLMDKVFIADLLRSDRKVTGAVGFSLTDGKPLIFQAKATIIADGSLMSQGNKFFVVNTGVGISMAYRAGAELMNAEFGPGYGYGFKDGELYKRTNLFLYYENAQGELFMGNYYPEFARALETGQPITEDFSLAVDAMSREIMAGRGPIYIDFRKISAEDKNKLLGAVPFPEMAGTRRGAGFLDFLRDRVGVDPDRERIEVTVQNTCVGLGPVRVGLDCETTVAGLWAVGDACQNGSGWIGARASGTNSGFCIPFSMVSGNQGGRAAAAHAANQEFTAVDAAANGAVAEMLEPLGREGDLNSNDVIYGVQEVTIPVKYTLYRVADRLNEALGKLQTVEAMLPRVSAENYHELAKYHQARSMATVVGFNLNSALLRTESRGNHRRQDFPERDDQNWLKWIVISSDGQAAKYRLEPVPLDKYALKPTD